MFTNEVKFVFNLPLLAIALSAGLGFLTIYFSCVFSARKAAKISPIAAIRSSNDIKIKAKIEDKRLKKPVKIDLESKSGEQI